MKVLLVLATVAACVYANADEDRQLMKNDLTNLINAFSNEKTAFAHMLDKTSEMKMANKTACLTEAINQILRVSVDATKLEAISKNLTAIFNRMNYNTDAATLALYKQQVFTGNNTYITQILNEAKMVANNLEEAVDTMVIDKKC